MQAIGATTASTVAADPDEEVHLHVVRILTWVSSILSIIGSLMIIYSYARHKKLRSFSVKLLFLLSIADFFSAVSHFIQNTDDDLTCRVQASMQQFFFLASFLWIFCIAVDQYLRIVKQEKATFRNEILYSLLSWGLPLVITLGLEWTKAFGPTDLWCWIRPEFDTLRWTTFYGPEITIVICVLVLNFLAMRSLSSTQRERAERSGRAGSKGQIEVELYAYLLAFLLIRTPSVVHRIHETVSTRRIYTLRVLHAIGSPLQGFVNFVLFFSNKSVRGFMKHHGLCGGESSEDDESLFDEDESLLSNPAGSTDPLSLEPFPSSIGQSDIINTFVGTWNLGGNAPPTLSTLRSWIPRSGYGVYAIGVQECTYRVPENEDGPKGLTCEQHWFKLVRKALSPNLEVVGAVSMGGLRLIVLVKSELLHTVSHLCIAKEGTGAANVGENKGAVGIAFRLGSLSLCFVDVHLAAHAGAVEDRNKDVVQIVRRLTVGDQDLTTQFHVLFFFGDLNYRIVLPKGQVLYHIEYEKWEKLNECDELNRLRVGKGMFYGFCEGALCFPPTYKYEVGHDKYASKQRAPAWCDRILWRARQGVHVQQTFYHHVTEVDTSDHRPVNASFRIGYPNMLYIPTVLREELIEQAREREGDAMQIEGHVGINMRQADALNDTAMSLEGENAPPTWKWCIDISELMVVGVRGPRRIPVTEPYLIIGSKFAEEVHIVMGDEDRESESESDSDEDSDLDNTTSIGHARTPSHQRHTSVQISMASTWEKERCPPLYVDPLSWTQVDLQSECLILTILDNALRGDDELSGQCAIELRGAFSDEGTSFETPVLLDTAYNGYCLGKVRVFKVDRERQ